MKLLTKKMAVGIRSSFWPRCAPWSGVSVGQLPAADTRSRSPRRTTSTRRARSRPWPPIRKQFEAAHPGVTVKRQYVPFANLDTKLLTQAAGHDLPNLLAVDNPFVSTMISTGQVVPISGLKGFSTKGYFPAVINEGLSNHQYYSLPVAGANSIALIYNIAMLKAANLTPPKTWAQLVSDAKALTTSDHYGIALTCEAAEDTTWQWEPFFWSNGGNATFSNVSAAPGVQALNVWNQLITDGSASKDCLQWSQTPAASTQFIDGKAAMMVNGPWNFPTMNQPSCSTASSSGSFPSRPGWRDSTWSCRSAARTGWSARAVAATRSRWRSSTSRACRRPRWS